MKAAYVWSVLENPRSSMASRTSSGVSVLVRYTLLYVAVGSSLRLWFGCVQSVLVGWW